MHTPTVTLLHEEYDGEGYWHRYPAEVTDAGNEVEHGAVVHGEVFARQESAECLLGIIQSADVDGVVLIARKELHGEVQQRKHPIRQQGKYEL